MTLLRINSCQRCKFAARSPELECRRLPPQVNAVAITVTPPGSSRAEVQIQQIAAFPHVQPDSWCGEFVLGLAVDNAEAPRQMPNYPDQLSHVA